VDVGVVDGVYVGLDVGTLVGVVTGTLRWLVCLCRWWHRCRGRSRKAGRC